MFRYPCVSLQVDSASALIVTAKNLMMTVVETVKTCYIASTAVSKQNKYCSSQLINV